MSMDLLNRLITDIVQVTETLISTQQVDLAPYQASGPSTVEKTHGSKGLPHHHRHKAHRPMSDGIHRGVC